VANLLIFAVGPGLVALGSWLSARRKRAVLPAVNPAK
jgi:hypothetical protein